MGVLLIFAVMCWAIYKFVAYWVKGLFAAWDRALDRLQELDRLLGDDFV